MKKILILIVAMLIACAPMSFANWACDSVSSDVYLKAAGGKLLRGIENAALGWVELVNQPMKVENKWEGVSKGIGYAILRTLGGAVEAVTFFVPGANVPQVSPACPTDIFTA